ncbi:twin-arginine translocase TatA/TatE family subunit [Deinococcus ficus]|uniref:Sec-independent protein translocase protein TatA n=1 Tax=Deinococcus ficus TaxID=317577 RepID=A0A221SVH7_9DEIO|nr:twin-arginine translocase TatA/TatE family subunit [Deinococcus ficus]ASN80642.1 hypothetical protein DFI_06180 [Deinococcus ficus]
MGNIGGPEILIILVAALLLFGPRRLPDLAKSAGQALRSFKQATSAVTDDLRAGLDPAAPAPGMAPTASTAAAVTPVAVTPVTVAPPAATAPAADPLRA